jgi:exosortase J
VSTDSQNLAPASVSADNRHTHSSCVSTRKDDSDGTYCIESADAKGFANTLRRLPAAFYAGAVVAMVAVGCLSQFPLWLAMWRIWTTDPLRSIGAAFPLVACVGVLAAWRQLGWSMRGTFWALPLVGISLLLAHFITASALTVSYYGVRLINIGTVLFIYGSGAVLLFGGTRLLRASIAPLCLLLFINPVPIAFNPVVDLPLQYLSASVARSFAHLMGVQPTGVQLRMMFAPDFGMFIAPGCNGVRGSITLFYLALIFGYTRHLRPTRLVLTSIAALLLGYLLNLLRLCVLVVYYRIGVSFPSIQKHGVAIDYGIGCVLFLVAALAVGMFIRSLEPSLASGMQEARRRGTTERPSFLQASQPSRYHVVARMLCFLTLTLVFFVLQLRAAVPLQVSRLTEEEIVNSFPAKVGAYSLTRTWTENSSNGTINLAMADYAILPDSGVAAEHFIFGLWVGSANHLVADSKYIQGIRAQWEGSFNATAQQAFPAQFSTSFYDNGLSRQYDAEATCSSSGCWGRPFALHHRGFVFSTSGPSNLISATQDKSLPILLRREWLDSDPALSADLRAQFETDARLFISQVDLKSLAARDGSWK